jgi:hypothetical protein
MTNEEARALRPGIYRLAWSGCGKGQSLAAVGSDEVGRRWYAPCNWVAVPSYNWEGVVAAFLVAVIEPCDNCKGVGSVMISSFDER